MSIWPSENLTWLYPSLPFGQPLWSVAAIVNKLVSSTCFKTFRDYEALCILLLLSFPIFLCLKCLVCLSLSLYFSFIPFVSSGVSAAVSLTSGIVYTYLLAIVTHFKLSCICCSCCGLSTVYKTKIQYNLRYVSLFFPALSISLSVSFNALFFCLGGLNVLFPGPGLCLM